MKQLVHFWDLKMSQLFNVFGLFKIILCLPPSNANREFPLGMQLINSFLKIDLLAILKTNLNRTILCYVL